jgi:hypothetical protein
MHAAMKYSAPKSAPQCCSESTHYADDSDYFIHTGDDEFGGSMSRAHRKAGVHDDAIIAFLLFCLEIYQAEQQRRRKLH